LGGSVPAGDEIVERVGSFAREQRLLGPRDRLVLAVSGGPDSVCMLHVLAGVLRDARSRLVVVHVDHGFRLDSASDAEFVRALAAQFGLACEVARVDGPSFSRRHGLGIEHAGRALRYQALARAAARHRARAAATAHTLDDSIESLVMHLLRGAGPEGLGGIAPDEVLELARLGPLAMADLPDSLRVVRPLLGIRRTGTVGYCSERGLEWRSDPTNDDPAFLRNRVRNHLLPILRTYNPRIEATLARTAAVIRAESVWLDELMTSRWRRLARGHGTQRLELPLEAWRRQPLAVQRRLLRRALAALGADDDGSGFETIERAVQFASADRPRRIQLARGVTLRRAGDTITLDREGDR